MAWSENVPYGGANALYVKPVTPGSLPSSTPSWATDVVASGTPGFGLVPFAGLTDSQVYQVYEQLGGAPADTDANLGALTQTTSADVSTLITEVAKIVKSGEERSLSRAGKTPVTLTETRV